MRTALLILVLCSVARAGSRVVVLSDRDAMPAALQSTLATRGVEVTTLPSPDGALRLDRAASAQHIAIANQADAGVWIDADEVWVVSADGRFLRHAPVPTDATPSIVATLATSLLDEMFAPPRIGVAVHVDVPSPVVAAVAPAPTAEVVVAAPVTHERWRDYLLEVGLTYTPASYGIEAELAIPISRRARLGVFAGASQLTDFVAGEYDVGTKLYDAGGEIRYVGEGSIHFDIGLGGGVMSGTNVYNDGPIDEVYDPMYNVASRVTAGFAALRIAAVREYEHGGLELAIEPILMFDLANVAPTPGIMSSLRWEIPL